MAGFKEVADALAGQIASGSLPAGSRIPSEADLAVRFGVSRQTVQRAMQVLQRAGLVIRKRRWGTFVAEPEDRTLLIGFISDHSHDFPQSRLIRSIQAELGPRGRLLLSDTHDLPAGEKRAFGSLRSQVSGVIAYAGSRPELVPFYRRWAESAAEGEAPPIVFVDRMPEGIEGFCAVSDNLESSRTLIRQVREAGHERIAFFSGDNRHVSTIRERFQGFAEGYGDAIPERLIRWFPKSLEQDMPRLRIAVQDSVRSLALDSEPPTAIFCTQDVYAAGAVEAIDLLPAGIRRPLIFSYNDWPELFMPVHRLAGRIVQPHA
ncbi:MAG: GntR family transcriptional regulator [Fimbriimonadaceae bacterium]|nr:GntR family transcriptional regulator [Fimbriimonadaceae bacterium]